VQKLHKPSADMICTGKRIEENSDQADVHECKHSIHLPFMTSAWQAQSRRTAMCQMFMSANTSMNHLMT
jgi:hypothetical protein